MRLSAMRSNATTEDDSRDKMWSAIPGWATHRGSWRTAPWAIGGTAGVSHAMIGTAWLWRGSDCGRGGPFGAWGWCRNWPVHVEHDRRA